jgi:hypothetical protein
VGYFVAHSPGEPARDITYRVSAIILSCILPGRPARAYSGSIMALGIQRPGDPGSRLTVRLKIPGPIFGAKVLLAHNAQSNAIDSIYLTADEILQSAEEVVKTMEAAKKRQEI